MTRHSRMMICLLAAATIGLGLTSLGVQRLQAQAAAKASKTAVAVVNVGELIQKCKKNVDFQAEMQKKRGTLQAEAEAKQNKINLLRADLDVIANAQDRAKKEREVIEALSEFQAWQQIQNQYILRDQRAFLIELYGDIDKTVAAVAQREGYDLVLFDTPIADFDKLNPEQLVQAIGERRVIYRTDNVNLTPLVLDQMDIAYQNRGNN